MAPITEQELKSALDEELWQNRRACVATPQTPSVQVTWLLRLLCSSKCWCFYSAACGGSFVYARCNGSVTRKERHPIKSQFSNCELFWLRPAG